MSIEHRYRTIRDEIEHHCVISSRSPEDVTLIAVSKNQPASAILELYSLGHRDFGESRQQELEAKVAVLPKDIIWHFIGTLQSNKVRKVSEHCSLIHTIDSPSQLKEIGKLSEPIQVLIELNIAEEEQKSGILQKSLDGFIKSVIECDQANLTGLMTIGPVLEDAEMMRPHFARMQRLNQQYGLKVLSMGMSGNFGVAIQEGATHIRVGTSLFGER